MHRRRRSKASILEALVFFPSWLSLILAALAFVACSVAPYVLQFNNSPILFAWNALIAKLPDFAPYATLPFLLTAAVSGARSLWPSDD